MDAKELETALKPLTDKVKELEDKNKALEAKEVTKRFEPNDINVKVVNNPEDVLKADKFGGFKSAGHFYNDVMKAAGPNGRVSKELSAWHDANIKTAGTMEEGDLAQGGYTVPIQVNSSIRETSLEAAVVEPRATIQPMSTYRLELPADVDADHSSNFFGGITIYRQNEGKQKTASNPTFGRIALTLHEVAGLVGVTDWLLQDSAVALESYLTRKFSQAISFTKDDDFLNGTGANQPLGVLHSANPALITVDAVSGQGASTIIAENIIDMFSRMYPEGQNRAVWIMNPECFPQLAKMALAAGTAGIPVWMPANNLAGSPFQTLMGRPLILTEKCQALGTAGDIAFVDFSQYLIGQRGNGTPEIASSIHLYFDYDKTAFRFVLRYDGQPSWLSAITPKRGSKTLSPFIVLNSTRT